MSGLLLLGSFLLDLALGDPRGWPHPIIWIGRLITRLELWLRAEITDLRIAGTILVLLVLAITGMTAWGVLACAALWSAWLALAVALWIGWSCLALKSLHRESAEVIAALENNDLPGARQALSMIVGRETSQLDEEAILKACLETVAENASDGVIAPLFYLLLGGPILALLYKAVNTMDSMVGYKNEKYKNFGRSAARLDDLLNLIPARLTAALIAVAAVLLGLNGAAAWRVMKRDARKHASPNAGWPEAAAAGALGVQLGGPSDYFGTRVEKATLGDAIETLCVDHYHQMIRLLYVASGLAVSGGLLLVWDL
ncbi:MAG: cobalamin biosynthesis protein CobD [Desulfuromonas sp.]|nr:MAG: cobalamin biosynthesis protein CobD [Desulfuromonas sp.]